ncbi:polyadenylate-binding protein-interacting protein 7-like [Bidens hawaiensis]|uniref:polyadenylate-binding protein-interacting protein 7-like n=1 Tax=Bidens hawaiensis TaxID=980011 RepID=UPI00404900A2
MSLFNKGSSSIDKTLSATGKTIRLNPDAKEFVPFALRSPSATVGAPDASSSFGDFGTTTTLGKAVLDRSESSVSHNSDDEAHDYWRHQLPDDITPDFNAATDDDSLGTNALRLSTLSLADVNETSRFTNNFQKESSHHPLASSFQSLSAKPWDMQGQQLVNGVRDMPPYNGDRGHAYLDDMLNEQHESTEVNPLDFLASQFAGSTAESPADAYFAIAGNLNLTTERLAQLELQADGGFNQKHNRDPYQDATIGSSRSSRDLTSSYYDAHGRMKYRDRLANRSSARSAPVWLETGDAFPNMYSEMLGEARDHACLRNAYFEQARQAYLIGHKALAKELSVKGQLHNIQMKAAHVKAQESIYRQRNPVSPVMHANGRRGHERLIDLQGLHVIEATHVLKRDLTMLRNAARSADQCLHVYICVGSGHHTRGTHMPARLPVVQRYLLEEEGLDYSEPQPGLLRVHIY